MTAVASVFLAGASRGLGREIAQCLVAQNLHVKALLRPQSQALHEESVQEMNAAGTIVTELAAMGVQVVLGDALDPGAVEQAMDGSAPIDAVISTIGGQSKDGYRSDYLGNKHLIDAAVKAKVKKFILVSSIGSGNSVVALSPQILEVLAPALAEKEKAEKYLIESGLVYTIIRPGGLKSEPATGKGLLTEDPAIAGIIHRADVAQLVCQCLVSDQANDKILSAVDREMIYGQPAFQEFILS